MIADISKWQGNVDCVLMPGFGEVVMDVAFQHPAIGAMVAIVAMQMRVHSVERIIHALAALASTVVA